MENKKQEHGDVSLPDISGVFLVDETGISGDSLAPPVETDNKIRRQPIMLSDPLAEKKVMARNKKRRAELKAKKRKKQKKQNLKRALTALLIAVLLVGCVLGIKGGLEYAKRPAVSVATAEMGSLIQLYENEAMLKNCVVSTGRVGTVAVFAENDYDIYDITQGLSAQLVSDTGELLATGVVESIQRAGADDELFAQLLLNLPNEDYSAVANYLVTVQLDEYITDLNLKTAHIQIITNRTDNAVLVPSEAVYRDNTQYYVWSLQKITKQVQRVDVSVGINHNGKTEIVRGLNEGVTVAYQRDEENTSLTDGIKVKIQKDERGITDETNE